MTTPCPSVLDESTPGQTKALQDIVWPARCSRCATFSWLWRSRPALAPTRACDGCVRVHVGRCVIWVLVRGWWTGALGEASPIRRPLRAPRPVSGPARSAPVGGASLHATRRCASSAFAEVLRLRGGRESPDLPPGRPEARGRRGRIGAHRPITPTLEAPLFSRVPCRFLPRSGEATLGRWSGSSSSAASSSSSA